MRYALIDRNGVVKNVVEVNDLSKWITPDGLKAVVSDVAGTGWNYDGIVFTPPVNGSQSDATHVALSTDVDFQDLISRLRGAGTSQIKTYVQNNVTDLASAKILLAKMLLLIAYLLS